MQRRTRNPPSSPPSTYQCGDYHFSRAARAAAAGLLLGLAACSGDVGPEGLGVTAGGPASGFGGSGPVGAAASPAVPGGGGPAVTGGASGSGVVTPAGKPGAASSCGDARVEPRAVLVPPRQYVNVLRDLLGQTAVTDQDAAASSDLVIETVDRPRMTTATLDRFTRLAENATNSLRGKTGMFLNCTNLMD